jgi:RimJ/RimL family protein N-acetyltransferase
MPESPVIRLVPFTAEQLVAIVEEPDSFDTALGFDAADGLRSFFVSGEASATWLQSLRGRSGTDPWTLGFAVRHEGEGKVIGTAGFKGPPSPEGVVEIAYAIVPAFEGRGCATEAARALIDFASRHQVSTVIAHTLPALNASCRVLSKCGFERTGEVIDPDDGPVWRWELGIPAR